jgi:DNA-binding MarR family transcriptional regulator
MMRKKEESLGRMVSILYRIGQSHMGNKLEPYNIGAGQVAFLAELLLKDGISQDEVASNFRCNKATAARAIQHLERHGYVERRQSVNDGRVKKVFVTDKAREFQPVLFSFLEEWTDTLFEGFSTEERELVLRHLHRIVKTASKVRTGEGTYSKSDKVINGR